MKRIVKSTIRREPNPPAKLHMVDRQPFRLGLSRRCKETHRNISNYDQKAIEGPVKVKVEPIEYQEAWTDDFERDIRPSFGAIDDGQGATRSLTPPFVPNLPAIEWSDVKIKKEECEDSASEMVLANEYCVEDYSKPMPGVLGYGKGVSRSLPKYEFKSVYQYIIPELDAENPAPWRQDPAVPTENLKPTILSVVASVSLGRALKLEDVAIGSIDLHYDPESFTPLVMRLKKPTATALIFKSGKMVVTGTKSEEECLMAAKKFARRIQKIGFRVSVSGLQIQNITATANLGFRVRVHLLGKDKNLSTQVGYHPELFTGVSVPLTTPKGKVIIFRTGSILITGVKSIEEVNTAIKLIYPLAKLHAN